MCKEQGENLLQEYLITGGTILTMNESAPRAESVLVRMNTIAAAGTDAEVRNTAGKETKVIDIGGRTLAPGFNDCHSHLTQIGQQEMMVDLSELSKSEIIEKLMEYERSLEPNDPLLGRNWDYPSCPNPHKRDLDVAFPDRPVLLFQFSGHGGWANSAALAFLKIKRDTPDWDMGGLDRDAAGELTGIIRELGGCPRLRKYWIRQALNRKYIRKGLLTALSTLVSHGITSIQDNTWFATTVSEIAALHRKGLQTVRISCWSHGVFPLLDFWLSHKRFKPDWYVRGPRKHFIDGSFSTKTAWLLEDYADAAGSVSTGKSSNAIERWLKKATRQGRQIACHSIGDAATKAYCDALERLSQKPGYGEDAIKLRHRIEHGQLIAQDDVERITRLGMVVSAQPHATANPEKDEQLLGAHRARQAYAYRDLLDAGVPLAFGSDFPAEATFSPLFGVHLAVNREGGQAITPEEAIKCYTVGSARAEFAENRKGQIATGFLADMVLLSADPTGVDPMAIKDIQVDATIVDGRFVFQRPLPFAIRSSSQKPS